MFKRVNSTLPLLLGNICLLFLLLAGGLFAFASAYQLQPNTPVLLAGCGCFSILFACLWSARGGGWIALGLLGLDAFAIWRLWEWLELSVGVLGMAVSGRCGQEPMTFYLMRDRAAGTLTVAFLLLAFALACILGWLAVRERCWHLPAVIVTVPLLSALMAGVLPHLLPLMAAAAGWGTLLLSGLYNRKNVNSLGKGLWLNLGGISALLLLLLALLPQEGYTRPDWATNTRNKLIQTVNDSFAGFWSGGSGEGGSFWNLDTAVSADNDINGEVDLSRAGPRRYSRSVVMQAVGGEPGRTYLRGGASAVYTGSSWESPYDAEYEDLKRQYSANGWILDSSYTEADGRAYTVWADADPAFFPAMTVPDGTGAETMALRYIRISGSTAYVPYRLCSFPDGLVELSGDGGAARSMDEYQVSYVPGGPLADAFTPLTGTAAEAESLYRNYVYRHYLDVPEKAEQTLTALLRRGLPDMPEAWLSNLAEAYQKSAYTALRVAKLLESAAVYDLNPSRMERGEDFATHFLEEGRGYCVHFATTGALLLRLCGIPARYVEGYAPLIGAGEVSDVRDSDAHAWVEIYLDGYGWYPVEMTPGRQGETPDTVAPEILQTEVPPGTSEEEEQPPEEEQPADSPQPETPDANANDGAADSPDEREETEKRDFSWLWKAAAVLLALAAPYGGYRLVKLMQRKRREHPDTNRSVIYAYLRYQQLRRRGGPEEPELEELGRKAKFSQHRLTEEERQAAWKCADHAAGDRGPRHSKARSS